MPLKIPPSKYSVWQERSPILSSAENRDNKSIIAYDKSDLLPLRVELAKRGFFGK